MATPLSGSLLHLEVASRGLGKDGGPDVAAIRESLRIAQEELLRGSAWLESLGEVFAASEEEPAEFSLSAAVARGAGAVAEEAERRGLRLELPAPAPQPVLFGNGAIFRQAVTEVTRNALARLAGPGAVRWSVASAPGGSEALCVFPAGAGAEEDPARTSFRHPRLLLARWAVEGHGGTLEPEREGPDLRVVLRFPEGS